MSHTHKLSLFTGKVAANVMSRRKGNNSELPSAARGGGFRASESRRGYKVTYISLFVTTPQLPDSDSSSIKGKKPTLRWAFLLPLFRYILRFPCKLNQLLLGLGKVSLGFLYVAFSFLDFFVQFINFFLTFRNFRIIFVYIIL